MAAPMPRSLAAAAAQGDHSGIQTLIANGANLNERSKDGMTPLGVAAFWGYADIVQTLLKSGADINATNLGTKWTPLHCAAFQGHGPVVMKLLAFNPDLQAQDMRGRTPTDFASALDTIWPFFADAGCKRTSKADLIKMDIVYRVSYDDPSVPKSDFAHFSRPGSAYAMHSDMPGRYTDPNMEIAAVTGDVLAAMPEEPMMEERDVSLHVFNN